MNDASIKGIRDVADEFGLTLRALRFYEQKELIAPARNGTKRLFTERDHDRLRFIVKAKRVGLELEEIRQLLKLRDKGQDVFLPAALKIGRRQLGLLVEKRDGTQSAIAELEAEMEQVRADLERREQGEAA